MNQIILNDYIEKLEEIVDYMKETNGNCFVQDVKDIIKDIEIAKKEFEEEE